MKQSFSQSMLTFVYILLLTSTSLSALKTDKVYVKNNMEITYLEEPESANNFNELFNKGTFYGRLRAQYLDYNYKNEDYGKTADNSAQAVGGNLSFSTAFLHGFGATAGFYSSHTINTNNLHYTTDGSTYDAGKTPRNVYNKYSGSGDPIDVLAVSYIEYKFSKTTMKYGRQIFDSAVIHSNDVFMIPNTMEGFSVETKDISNTRLRLAYFTSQKLMGHNDFHSVIASGDANDNDDAGVHKGLSANNLEIYDRKTNPGMGVFSSENNTFSRFRLNLDAMYMDDFFYQVIPEINYKIPLVNKWSLTPGIRYFYQKDKGAGDVGGAAISGTFVFNKSPSQEQISSYHDISSVDAYAWMFRLVLTNGPGNLSFGYSRIADKADLISAWRGFPTAGYTRDLTELDWLANTESYMIKASYDFGKAGLANGLFTQLDYENMNYDELKIAAGTITKTDRYIIHADIIQAVKYIPGLAFRMRLSWVNADANPKEQLDYNSYTDVRFEMDYFF